MKTSKLLTCWGATLFTAALLNVNASAQDPTNWGTWAATGTLNCISADCSGGGVSGGDAAIGPEDDQVEATPATSTIINPLGNATSLAGFTTAAPGLEVFQISGDGTSVPGGASRAEGAALAFYRYSGPTTSVTVTASLSSTFSGPLSGENSNLDGIYGAVRVFTDPDDIMEIDLFDEGARLFCLGECYIPDFELIVEINTGVDIPSDSALLTLNDGDGFYLQGYMNLGAAGGGIVATTGSGFTVSFSSTPGLTSVLPAGSSAPDADGDTIADAVDNCTFVANSDQRDSNGDGHGNVCDFDYNNDCVTNFMDLPTFANAFGSSTGDANFDDDVDLDGNGVINFLDLGAAPNNFAGAFTNPPGPSAVPCILLP
ncbi:MAG: hypothetical protein HKN70_15410 [Gammaproteobacteria bacterium]|nr:hypothetical protein [Gammaproteobacteria bacterium]